MVIKIIMAVVVVIALGLGVIFMPTMEAPVDNTALRRDNHRLADLKLLSDRIQIFWEQHKQLPSTVGQLIDGKAHKVNPKDPRYSTDYEYHVTGQQRYQLCAIFSIPTPPGDLSKFWRHPNDHFCFDFYIGQEVEPTPSTER